MRGARLTTLLAALVLLGGAKGMDPVNPTCPAKPDWGPSTPMSLTPTDRGGKRVLIADGVVDASLPARLAAALSADERIEEVWLRSRGGNAKAGNAAGKIIRSYPGMVTRIPSGWTCFSSCNFVFMGGDRRFVEPGGIFMVHMFTYTGQRDVIDSAVKEGSDGTTQLIGEIEQLSALLASEDNDFLIRMGISRRLLTEIMYQQAATGGENNKGQRYCLSQDEAREYNVMPLERAG
ncbi:COG3904 family protein [Allopontixanthobacter sediminis]|uniref:Peptidase S14 n=1 Tax=Allopontixanthobacter sediminis TaxID=1689985 RepID=A0A845AZ90_9SPHN|nr:hypothetical protein [Allopontixanthobacter sediminis]MXP43246.1 hypothetical protein [Allopontixanthobacter sediminis]